MWSVFIVHYITNDVAKSDIEEALEFPHDVKWGKL
jgi:hypothetical protein